MHILKIPILWVVPCTMSLVIQTHADIDYSGSFNPTQAEEGTHS